MPRAVLAIASWLLPAVNAELARKVAAAVVMDRDPFAFDPGPTRARWPGLPCTPVAEALARLV